ncbi:hypothetical protein DPMN_080675 [Dreissena polymorpha]|uniref:Uncharacterized protein n=1 Tax=Dreissena polymorpha TaxID=45954 RepID=A0A9D3YWW1_DREPO|nr:hypothetical protein DPMN_080675 [Dreissena polymorpha]
MKRCGQLIGRRSSTRMVLFSSVAVTALLLVLHVFRILGDEPQLDEKDSYMGQMAVKVKQLDEKDSNIGQMTVKVKQLDEKDSNISQMAVKVKQQPSGKLKYLNPIDRIKETNEVIKQDCRARDVLLSQKPLPVGGLVSFPGSGNTWVRHLLQQLTGIGTASVYCDGTLSRNGSPSSVTVTGARSWS